MTGPPSHRRESLVYFICFGLSAILYVVLGNWSVLIVLGLCVALLAYGRVRFGLQLGRQTWLELFRFFSPGQDDKIRELYRRYPPGSPPRSSS